MIYLFAIILICKFGTAVAENLQFIPYENTYKCSAAVVHTTGARCESEDICQTVSPIQSEKAELMTQSGKKFLIPPLVESFPKSKSILRDEGTTRGPQPRMYGIEKVTCLGNDKIGVLYTGGGNCKLGCENYVIYTINQDEGVTNALLAE